MSSCWKCGAPTSDGVLECLEHCTTQFTQSVVQVRRVDWRKVQSIEDMKRIMSVFGLQVVLGSPAEDALRDYLED